VKKKNKAEAMPVIPARLSLLSLPPKYGSKIDRVNRKGEGKWYQSEDKPQHGRGEEKQQTRPRPKRYPPHLRRREKQRKE
jgi:hypothetical protein